MDFDIVFSQKRVFGAPKSYFQGCFWGNGIVFGNFKPFLGKIVLFLGEQRKEFRVRKKDYKGRCTKVASSKSETACRLYDDLMIAYLRNLEEESDIISIQTNVPLDGMDFTSDFLCQQEGGDFIVRECVYRKYLTKPMTAQLLDTSRTYWLKHGIYDWGVVVDAQK